MSIWHYILGLTLLVGVQAWLNFDHPIELKYSDFKKAVVARQVSDIMISKDNIRGLLNAEGVRQFSPPG